MAKSRPTFTPGGGDSAGFHSRGDPDGELSLKNDFVFALTGYRPDFEFLNDTGITLEPDTQRPRTNPETLESERPGIYLAGVIVAGMHTNEIFIENGRFHGQLIADSIASRLSI